MWRCTNARELSCLQSCKDLIEGLVLVDELHDVPIGNRVGPGDHRATAMATVPFGGTHAAGKSSWPSGFLQLNDVSEAGILSLSRRLLLDPV